MNGRIIFADTETTRIDPQQGRVWEIALIVRDPGEADQEFCWLIRASLEHADPVALSIGGYHQRMSEADVDRMPGAGCVVAAPGLRGGMKVFAGDVAYQVAALCSIGKPVIVCANPPFDVGHLDAFCRRHGEAIAPDYHHRDIGSMVDGWIHGQRREWLQSRHSGRAEREQAAAHAAARFPMPATPKLSDCARAAGLDPASYKAHTALDDARLARDIYDRITGVVS